MSVQKNGQYIIKGTINKQGVMWKVPLETQQSEAMENNILAQTAKTRTSTVPPKICFSPTTESLLKAIK